LKPKADKATAGQAYWVVATYFLLTLSVGLLTDFTRRLLSSNPDSVGIAAIALQAALTVGASSSFTSAGRDWLRARLAGLRIATAEQERFKFWMMLALTVLLFAGWLGLPRALAYYYNNRAFAVRIDDPGTAMEQYNRALSLNPGLYQAHVNLAGVYVRNYDFEHAAEEFRKALMLEHGDVVALDGLAYMLLLLNDPQRALRVLDEALAQESSKPSSAEHLGAILKNLAWAEYQLGLLGQAERDAQRSLEVEKEAAAYCVLGRIHIKQNKTHEAAAAFKAMLTSKTASVLPTLTQPALEPDCKRLAKESIDETHP
jgi:Tfp pilus assembly protein PilF